MRGRFIDSEMKKMKFSRKCTVLVMKRLGEGACSGERWRGPIIDVGVGGRQVIGLRPSYTFTPPCGCVGAIWVELG